MTYWLLNLVFLVPALALGIVAAVQTARRSPNQRPFGRIVLTLVVILVLTAVFDNIMIAVELFGYNPDVISGAFLGLAPLEDFAYAIAAAMLLPGIWMLLPGRTTKDKR